MFTIFFIGVFTYFGQSLVKAFTIKPGQGRPAIRRHAENNLGVFMKKTVMLFVVMLAMASANAWTKKSSADDMTGEKWVYFTVDSKRSLSLDFPYKGRNHPYLMAYETKGRPVVIFSLEKGQISCHSSCLVDVKFDDEEVVEFEASGIGDDNRSITFKHSRVFAERVANVKRILIRAPIYRNGSPVVEFLPKKPLVLFPESIAK